MVEYAYRDLFYKSQQTKDILIVDTEAVVTINPGAAPAVENATVEIHTADLKINTFTLDESLCSEEDLTWGLMESAEVRFTIKNTRRIPNLKNTDYSKMVNIYIYFNNNSSTLFQVGQYICDSDKYSSDRRFRNIVLYDALYYLRSWDITEWYNNIYADNEDAPISVYDLRFSLFDYMFTEFDYPIEQNEETELVNDDCLVPKNIESDTITFDFFMGGILNANGVFGHMGRTGLFEYVTLVKYDAPTVTTVTDDFRKPPTTYEDFAVWGIGYVAVYDQNNIRLAYEGSSSYKRPSIYNIVDNFVLNGIYSNSGADELKAAVANIREQVTHRRYAPMDVEHVGDLCVEVGDNVAVTGDIGNYNTYVLERHLKGLGTMLDRYISRGNRKQPKYKINDNWHIGDSQDASADGTGGIGVVNDTAATNFIKYCRNIGIRLLQEPSVNLEYVRSGGTHQIEITWSDPSDITNYKPVPCAWAGTIVVRSESKPPVHPWDDCEILVNSTTRDEYSETPFVDNTIEENKKYYYGIFPYHIALDDAEHPIKYYRFTKVISVNTQRLSLAPLIVSHTVNGSDVTLTIEIPTLDDGSYSYVKAVAKKNSIPASKTDGTVIDISATATSVTFSGLDEQSHYYFVIFANDGGASDIASDPDDCTTGRNEGYNFAYTGSIQTFTAPKTGIYQLETWGAQGGNAEDSENELTARGGYGAYAKGEVLLVQGETLYIGVGGQNGFNGGGALPECILQYLFDGSIVNLANISDFSIIPQAIKEATSFTNSGSSISQPSNVGDSIYTNDRNTIGVDDEIVFAEDENVKISFGNTTSDIWGARIYNKQTDTAIVNYGFRTSDISGMFPTNDYFRKYYVGIVIDFANARGYFLLFVHTYCSYTAINGWQVQVCGGIENGKDYIYELFKDQI